MSVLSSAFDRVSVAWAVSTHADHAAPVARVLGTGDKIQLLTQSSPLSWPALRTAKEQLAASHKRLLSFSSPGAQ